MTDSVLRFGIVGTGIMARVHAASLEAYHRSAVVAWASRVGRPAEPPEGYSGTRAYDDVRALAEDAEVDAVLVATPDFAHTQPALEALAAGKPVLIEKPLATSLEEARAIFEAAERAGVRAMTLFNHRWVPAYWHAKEQTRDRQLGEPLLAYARKNDTIEVPEQMIRWAAETSPSWFLSSHDIDLVLWYFEEQPVEVWATAVSKVLRSRGINTPDAVQAQVRFANGAVSTFEACWTYPNTFPTMTDSFVELIFANGVIHLDRKHEQIELATQEAFTYPRTLLANSVGGRPGGSTFAAVSHFVDCVLDDADPLVDLESSVRVTQVVEAIQASYESGSPISLSKEVVDDWLPA